MKKRYKIAILGIWVVFVISLLTFQEMRLSKVNIEHRTAIFFENGSEIADFRKEKEIVFEKTAAYGETVHLEYDGLESEIRVIKINDEFHLIINDVVRDCGKLDTPYELKESYYLQICPDHENSCTVCLLQEYYIAKVEGFYPVAVKNGFLSVGFDLIYGIDHSFKIKIIASERRHTVEAVAAKGNQIIWSKTKNHRSSIFFQEHSHLIVDYQRLCADECSNCCIKPGDYLGIDLHILHIFITVVFCFFSTIFLASFLIQL